MSCPTCGLDLTPDRACPNCGAPPSSRPMASGPRSGGTTDPRAADGGADDLGRNLSFHGTIEELFPIFVRGLLLSLLTFGVYSFWARAEIRRYLLSRLEMEGDRFEYHGTGRESFVGFLRVLPIFLIAISAPFALFLFGDSPVLRIFGLIGFYALLLAAIPAAIALSWRYRLSRTSWRGVRFSWRGSLGQVYAAAARGFLITVITLGIGYPLLQASLRRVLIGHSWFGTAPFSYHENGSGLIWPRFWAVVLTYPTLGFYWFWYWARERRQIMAAIEFSGRRLWTNLTGGDLFKLNVPNGLFLILTLGLGWPVTVMRTWRVMATNFVYDGETNLSGIVQAAQSASADGDILEGMMDTDVAGLDFGI